MWSLEVGRPEENRFRNDIIFSQIKKDDRISTMLCVDCVEHLIQIAKFRVLLIESNELLLKELTDVIQNGGKSTEVESDDESEKFDCAKQADVEVGENVVLLEIEEAIDLRQSIDENYAQIKASENNAAEQVYGKNNQLDLICQICGKAFPSAKSRRIHEYVHNLGQFKCKLCERILTTTGFLRVHMQNIHSVFLPKSKPSDGQAEPSQTSHCQCDLCKMYFPYGRIGRHMRSHVKISGRPKCPSCPQTFSCRKNLQRHQKKQHGTDAQRPNEFHCGVCNETFHRPIELYEHSKEHDADCVETCDGYNLTCDECSSQHSNYEEYARHMIDVHRLERVQPYKCRICLMRNGSRTGLYMHINCHYNGSAVARAAVAVTGSALISGASTNKRFACAHCPLRLKNARRLEEHTRVHTGKPYTIAV